MADSLPPPAQLRRTSKAELQRLAREHEVPGRTSMTKEQLVAALQEAAGRGREDQQGADMQETTGDGQPKVASRDEAFHQLALARARGEMVVLPRMLTGHDRRQHVRQTLREDHQHRIAQQDDEAKEKFDELARSLFSFFRGTSLLFYRDLAGEDAWMPTVLTLGDVHPENFGVMPSEDDVPIFGVNDFDEAYYAPFSWDLKRGATGFMIAAKTEGGLGRKKRIKVAREFVTGYIDAMADYAAGGQEQELQLRQDNAPKLVAKLIENALEDRSAWLQRKYHNEYASGFRADDELVPISSRREEFQAMIDQYVSDNKIAVPARAGRMRVKDVCIRKGQGTASLGLARYYLMIEGPLQDGSDDLILEAKQARRSALAGLVPPSGYEVDGEADRIRHAQGVQLVRADVFYGSAQLDGLSMMVRERAPYRDSIDADDLSSSQWPEYARICGRTLAQAHALSDEAGVVDHDIEPAVLSAIGPRELFVQDVVAFAEEAADRVEADHEFFKADHALGAFRNVDVVYR